MLSYGKSANQCDLTEIFSENLCGPTETSREYFRDRTGTLRSLL
jgi:hypothetical protein